MRARATKRSATAWAMAVVLGAIAIGVIFSATRVETAPTTRGVVAESAVAGPAGGVEAHVTGIVEGVLVATREPDGTLNVECTDHETAAAILAEVRP